jgi:hypothetical protein
MVFEIVAFAFATILIILLCGVCSVAESFDLIACRDPYVAGVLAVAAVSALQWFLYSWFLLFLEFLCCLHLLLAPLLLLASHPDLLLRWLVSILLQSSCYY